VSSQLSSALAGINLFRAVFREVIKNPSDVFGLLGSFTQQIFPESVLCATSWKHR
jgi:hypothetical protein